ncbi:MAG: nucleotidyltransferase domain-containing protein [Pirellulaceae bacterium]
MKKPQPQFVFPTGTQIVTRKPVRGTNGAIVHTAGAVGIVVSAPTDGEHSYRVRFADGFEAPLKRHQFMTLSEFKQINLSPDGNTNELNTALASENLFDRVILKCVIGSRAYGLETEESDCDLRGVYLPPAERHWSLYGVPEQLENDPTQEAYWELQKFLVLALKANPNVLECLYSPLVVQSTDLGRELISMRKCFLSKIVFQTFSGYVASQFKKMQTDLKNQGAVKWKHVMHLLRLLKSGIHVLQNGELQIDVGPLRDRLLEIKSGQVSWRECDDWRLKLQSEFEVAFNNTKLPDRPDYAAANEFLIRARRLACNEQLP